jgi:anti-sigma28 factor (negative regulator of flagellin synthesis)
MRPDEKILNFYEDMTNTILISIVRGNYMKVQNINNYMNYKVNSKAVKSEDPAKTRKFDVIDIKGTSNKDINSIKKKIASEINKETDINKLNKIKEAININSYTIDADEIARKLLK